MLVHLRIPVDGNICIKKGNRRKLCVLTISGYQQASKSLLLNKQEPQPIQVGSQQTPLFSSSQGLRRSSSDSVMMNRNPSRKSLLLPRAEFSEEDSLQTSQKLASSSRPAQALTTTTSQSLEVVEISEVSQNPAKGLNRNENNNKTVKEERVHRDRDKKNNVVVKTVSVGTKTSGISLTQPKDSSRLEMHKFIVFLTDRPTCLLCDQEIWIR